MEYLDPQAGETIVDATMGGGGYTLAIAQAVGPRGRVIAIDADPVAVAEVQGRLAAEAVTNVVIVQEYFDNLAAVVAEHAPEGIHGVVFDLGLSSAQLNDTASGFSFLKGEGLDMSFGKEPGATAAIVNQSEEESLAELIREYGEERYAGRIARAIVAKRPFVNARTLAEAVANAVPASYRNGRIHPATRTFQALRIATNRELERLAGVLPQARDALSQGGRLVVVAYHSLEDRIVKQFLRDEERTCICPPNAPVCTCDHEPQMKRLTKKVVAPTKAEIQRNPRARSAKLRAAIKQ